MTTPSTPRAGVVDRFLGMVDPLPGPPELAFGVGGLVLATLAHTLVWATAAYPVGTLIPDLWVAPVLAGYFLALSAFMRRTADSAFDDFRPALGDRDKEEVERRRLTSVRDRAALLGGAVLVLVTFAVYLVLVKPNVLPRPPIVEILVAVLWLPTSFVLGMVIGQTLSQLRAVRHLSQIARHIDILNPGPVDALSRVTLVGSIGLLVFIAVANLALPTTASGYIGLDVAVIVFAVLAFVLPLGVMHGRLSDQKADLLAASSARIRIVFDQLHGAIDARDTSAADGLNKMVSSALAERDLLVRLPTWPWTTTTVRGFASALLLPVVIFLITRAIDRVF